ncbi:hypothetical protein [Amycolatopsis sp.]|jgi:hypothetical protein|uniref:hypothetical protein n=1 Tax=Amycolatopsis sp. TaxID=37632 RepID=UPI002DF85B9B|nr:hypothetical protein [Amycolatopsis sp.]
MDLVTSAAETGRAEPPEAADVGFAARAGAWGVLAGTLITTAGISWDVQWHVSVGPDTFFTLSHLALYSGTTIAGIASLVMVLLSTSAQRAGRSWPRAAGGTPVRVFGGTFTAPLGYLISGIGAASFLLYGLLDLWWHSLYGFDAVLNSPPHVALFLSISTTMVGSVIVFAAAHDRRWGQLGTIVAIPVLITFAPICANAFSGLPLPFDPTIAGVVFFAAMLPIIGAGILRRPGTAIGIAVVLGALQGFLWWFSPWASAAYAASVGLPLRDGLTPQPPEVPGAIPMFLIVAAAAVELLLWQGRKRGYDGKTVLLVAGAVSGLIIAASIPLQQVLINPTSAITGSAVVALLIAGVVFGALGGFLGSRFTAMLRALAPVTAIKEAR